MPVICNSSPKIKSRIRVSSKCKSTKKKWHQQASVVLRTTMCQCWFSRLEGRARRRKHEHIRTYTSCLTTERSEGSRQGWLCAQTDRCESLAWSQFPNQMIFILRRPLPSIKNKKISDKDSGLKQRTHLAKVTTKSPYHWRSVGPKFSSPRERCYSTWLQTRAAS